MDKKAVLLIFIQDCVAGMNFAHDKESGHFENAIEDKLLAKQQMEIGRLPRRVARTPTNIKMKSLRTIVNGWKR